MTGFSTSHNIRFSLEMKYNCYTATNQLNIVTDITNLFQTHLGAMMIKGFIDQQAQFCWSGFTVMFPSVCEQNISTVLKKRISVFGDSFRSDKRKKLIDFEKELPCFMGGSGGRN